MVSMERVVIQVHPRPSKFILIHLRLTWIKRMEWLLDPPGTTRTKLDNSMSVHFRGLEDPLEVGVEHEMQ